MVPTTMLATMLASVLGIFVLGAASAEPSRQGSSAAPANPSPRLAQAIPSIAIIIDDMGYRRRHGEAAIELPWPLTYAVLPNAPHARYVAERLREAGKEVMIHMPMEPVGHQDPGPGALHIAMSAESARRAVWEALEIVPAAQGLNNHMGSRATANHSLMSNLMQTLAERTDQSFYFVDSRTTSASVARGAAEAHGVRYLSRDVFIDHHRSARAIRAQLRRLVDRALERGRAIGIAHPYRTTIAVLREELPRMVDGGVQLVPVSALPRIQRVARLH